MNKAVILWFRTSLLCPLAYFSDAYTFHQLFWWSLVTFSHIPTLCCGNICALHVNSAGDGMLLVSVIFSLPLHPALCTQWLSCVDHISMFLALWLLVGLANGERWQEMRGRKESEISSFLLLPPHRTTTGWLSFISVRACLVVSDSLQPCRL